MRVVTRVVQGDGGPAYGFGVGADLHQFVEVSFTQGPEGEFFGDEFRNFHGTSIHTP